LWGGFNSVFKLPYAGYRSYSSNVISNMGSNGYYWASTRYNGGTSPFRIYFGSSVGRGGESVSNIMSIRCFKNMAREDLIL
jgi:hypothetical protein